MMLSHVLTKFNLHPASLAEVGKHQEALYDGRHTIDLNKAMLREHKKPKKQIPDE